jgi:transposase
MFKKQNYTMVSPGVQRSIAAEYRRGVRGGGYKALSKKFNLPVSTVRHILKRAQGNGGDPVQPRGHKQRKLTLAEQRKIFKTLDRKPSATNRELAASVGDKIKQRTVSDYLTLAQPRFTHHVPVNQEPEEWTAEWKLEIRRFINKVKKIPLDKRIYGDETAVYANEASKVVRARRGKKVYRVKPRWGKRYTLHVYVRQTSVVYWELSAKNANDNEILRIAKTVAKHVKNDDVLFWDRLGRAGRKMKPDKQHFNPRAIDAIECNGAKVIFLPPKGKYLNPVELLFNDLKNHYIRPQYRKHGENISQRKLKAIIKRYMIQQSPTKLKHFFAQRANGRELIQANLLL